MVNHAMVWVGVRVMVRVLVTVTVRVVVWVGHDQPRLMIEDHT